MRPQLTTTVSIFHLLCIALLISGCSDSNLSPEIEVRQFIAAGVEAAEDRSHKDLGALIQENYQDQNGYRKTDLSKLLQLYFFQHKNIYLLTKISEVNFPTENQAQVTLNVAMAGSAISDASALLNLRAQIYRFELQLVKQDEWLLQEAKWQVANMADMQ